MTIGTDLERILPLGALLGEGPLWLGDALWLVDIKRHQVHRLTPATGAHQVWNAPERVGWVQPLADGGLLAGLKTGLFRFDPGDGRFTPLLAVEADRPGNRLNDATVDPGGRLWFGSMDDGERAKSGRVYRADARGVAAVADGIAIVNGPAVSPDGRTLYYCDTVRGLIHAAGIADDGTLVDVRVFVQIDCAVQGHPDGPIVDAEGHLWVGFYGGWCVRRYAPDGRQVAEIRLPVANVTKIAIGGPDGRTAYATTAADGLSDDDRARQPFAGDVFAFDAGVAGQPAYPVAAIGPALL